MDGSAPAGDRKFDESGHIPILLHRVTDLLRPGVEALGDDAIVVDGTLDASERTEYLLEQFPKLCVVGPGHGDNALRKIEGRFARFGNHFVAFHVRFDSLAEVLSGEIPTATSGSGTENVLARAARKGVADAFFDLGISSMQLGQVDRELTYRVDAPLGTRMDANQGITTADVLDTYSYGDIAHILSTYGGEHFAGKIASTVLREREKKPFTNSDCLVELLYEIIPATSRRKGGHPVKRTFQALRIEVNREFETLENVLPQIHDALAVNGRVVFINYQSSKDRIIRKDFVRRVKSTTPPGLPIELPEHESYFALITRDAEKAPANGIGDNPRTVPMRVCCTERI